MKLEGVSPSEHVLDLRGVPVGQHQEVMWELNGNNRTVKIAERIAKRMAGNLKGNTTWALRLVRNAFGLSEEPKTRDVLEIPKWNGGNRT